MKKFFYLLFMLTVILNLIACNDSQNIITPPTSQTETTENNVTNKNQNTNETTNNNENTPTNSQPITSAEEHTHTLIAATCTQPQKCTICEEVFGKPLGHSFEAATVTKPQTCSICGFKTGKPLGYPEIYGRWQLIVENDKYCNAFKEYYTGILLDVITLEFDKNFYDSFGYKCNANIDSEIYAQENSINANSGLDYDTLIKYNGSNYRIPVLKGTGRISGYFEISNDTVAIFPKGEGISGGDIYEKIVLQFNNDGNLVVRKTVMGEVEYGYLNEDVGPITIGMVFKKIS